METIQLPHGKIAIIDDEDLNKVNQFKWGFQSKGYAFRTAARKSVLMHRYILNLSFGDRKQIDHIDGNRLNNQKSNLRICTYSQNQMNRRNPKIGISGFKGVVWLEKAKKWMARIKFESNFIYLGIFIDKLDAAKSYNEAAKKYFGEFAYLNKIS